MSKWQCCPVCSGRGVDPFITASTNIPTRFSDPCHRCNGTGTIPELDYEPRCPHCGKKDGWFGVHLCN